MPRFIAFLRAINVGGRRVKMEQLRVHFEEMGFSEVATFIASGNVIFASAATDAPALERQIEQHLAQSLGYEVATFIRTPDEVAAIARYRPFAEPAVALNVGFVAAPLDAATRLTWAKLKTDVDDFTSQGREVYWLCRRRQSESVWTNTRLEKVLKTPATFRNMNTLIRLADKY